MYNFDIWSLPIYLYRKKCFSAVFADAATNSPRRVMFINLHMEIIRLGGIYTTYTQKPVFLGPQMTFFSVDVSVKHVIHFVLYTCYKTQEERQLIIVGHCMFPVHSLLCTILWVSVCQAGRMGSRPARPTCFRKVEFYQGAIDMFPPVLTTGSTKAIHVS